MQLKDIQHLELPPSADMHVHLRQGEMMELVVPHIRRGGVDTVFVMPNLVPPITTVARAIEYRSQLQSIDPKVQYLMSLFLHASVSPEVIAEAAAAGITGVKMYPQGATTNSENGVIELEDFFPTFAAMEKYNLVLNLHGEVPAGTVLTDNLSHEEAFLPVLKKVHERFPQLRIILEHCSTAAAIDAVRACGPTVAELATITAHHLYLTEEISCVDPLAFCKPIPKKASDRDALVRAACSGDPKFFFGSDSAPHPLLSKSNQPVPAGVFTQPFVTQLVLVALEEAIERGVIMEHEVTQEKLEQFLSRYGRRFYQLPDPADSPRIVLERKGEQIPVSIKSAGEMLEVGLSKAASSVLSLRWTN